MDYTEEIHKYLFGELTVDEKSEYESQLLQNATLRKKVEYFRSILDKLQYDYDVFKKNNPEEQEKFMRLITEEKAEDEAHLEGLDAELISLIDNYQYKKKNNELDAGQQKLRANLEMAYQEYIDDEKNISRFTPKKIILAAAAIIVILFGASIFFHMNKADNLTNDQLFSNFYHPFDPAVNYRGSQSEDASILEAIQLYQQAKYEEAIGEFEKIETLDTMAPIAAFYKAMTYMQLNDFQSSAEHLEKTLAFNIPEFTDKTKWYLGLCYLKLDKLPKSKVLFEELTTSKGLYKNNAVEILKEID